MSKKSKVTLLLSSFILFFLGFKIIQASLYVEDKLEFEKSALQNDNMISLTRGGNTYTIAVGTDDNFVIKNGSSTVIFKIDENGNIYFPNGSIKEGISLSDITDFPTDCPEGEFIYGVNTDGSLKCR